MMPPSHIWLGSFSPFFDNFYVNTITLVAFDKWLSCSPPFPRGQNSIAGERFLDVWEGVIFYHPTQIYHLQVFHPHGIVGQVNVTFHRIEHQVGNVLPFCFPFPFAFAFVLALALSASAPPFTFRLQVTTSGDSLANGHGRQILVLSVNIYKYIYHSHHS